MAKNLQNRLHLAVVLLCAWLFVTSPWVSMLRRIPAGAGWLDWAHVVAGFVALAVALLYWVVYSALRELSESGRIPATWLWAPNLFFLAEAIVLPWLRRPDWLPRFRRARRAPPSRHAEAAATAPAGPAPAWPDEPDIHPRHLVFPHLLDRYVGFAFLKVFFVDLSTLGGIYRVIGFLVLGVLLVMVSYLYQRTRAAADPPSDGARTDRPAHDTGSTP